PGFADRRAPVEQTHDALDDRDVRVSRRPDEHLAADRRPEHPAVEIAGRPTGHGRMMAGIDEVWPHLEGLHPAAPLFQSRQERQRHSGLPDAAMRARDDEPREIHWQPSEGIKRIIDSTVNGDTWSWDHKSLCSTASGKNIGSQNT